MNIIESNTNKDNDKYTKSKDSVSQFFDNIFDSFSINNLNSFILIGFAWFLLNRAIKEINSSETNIFKNNLKKPLSSDYKSKVKKKTNTHSSYLNKKQLKSDYIIAEKNTNPKNNSNFQLSENNEKKSSMKKKSSCSEETSSIKVGQKQIKFVNETSTTPQELIKINSKHNCELSTPGKIDLRQATTAEFQEVIPLNMKIKEKHSQSDCFFERTKENYLKKTEIRKLVTYYQDEYPYNSNNNLFSKFNQQPVIYETKENYNANSNANINESNTSPNDINTKNDINFSSSNKIVNEKNGLKCINSECNNKMLYSENSLNDSTLGYKNKGYNLNKIIEEYHKENKTKVDRDCILTSNDVLIKETRDKPSDSNEELEFKEVEFYPHNTQKQANTFKTVKTEDNKKSTININVNRKKSKLKKSQKTLTLNKEQNIDNSFATNTVSCYTNNNINYFPTNTSNMYSISNRRDDESMNSINTNNDFPNNNSTLNQIKANCNNNEDKAKCLKENLNPITNLNNNCNKNIKTKSPKFLNNQRWEQEQNNLIDQIISYSKNDVLFNHCLSIDARVSDENKIEKHISLRKDSLSDRPKVDYLKSEQQKIIRSIIDIYNQTMSKNLSENRKEDFQVFNFCSSRQDFSINLNRNFKILNNNNDVLSNEEVSSLSQFENSNKKYIKNNYFENTFESKLLVGSGGFGRVFKVNHVIDSGLYAVKTIPIIVKNLDLLGNISVLNEAKAMMRLESQFIVRYITCWFECKGIHLENNIEITNSNKCESKEYIDNKNKRVKIKREESNSYSRNNIEKYSLNRKISLKKKRSKSLFMRIYRDDKDLSNSISSSNKDNITSSSNDDFCVFKKEKNINNTNLRSSIKQKLSNSNVYRLNKSNNSKIRNNSLNKLKETTDKNYFKDIWEDSKSHESRSKSVLKIKSKTNTEKEKNNLIEEISNTHIKNSNHINYENSNKHSSSADIVLVFCIQMEYCNGVPLNFLMENITQKLELCVVEDIFIQITKGVNDIHSNKLVHRDLK